MKTLVLRGTAWDVAEEMMGAAKRHNDVREAWEEKTNREASQLVDAENAEMMALMKKLKEVVPELKGVKNPSVDLRYYGHGFAFVFWEEEEKEEGSRRTADGLH